ncbi:hypothetical protein [Flavobacterium bizetiae]|uniref:hypothetical protein n=1 Tax=Flavobacterium bizetiae TaxID=2704140 RepID=UPI0037582D31
MNYKIGLSRALILFFILIQICCKKENTQNDGEISEKKPIHVSIDKNYQKDEPITGNEKLKVKSVINFSKKYNSPELWQYKWDMKTGYLEGVHALANGNMLFVIEESDENRNNTAAYVLILDKEGKEIKKQKLALKPRTKYDLFTTQVETDNQGGFTLFIKKEDRTLTQSVEKQSGEGRMRYNLKEYHIDKLKFNNTYSGYETLSKSMESILLKSFQEKGISYIPTGNFYVEYLKGKIFVYGQVGKSEIEQMPFVAVLDTNLKLIKVNVFEQYVDTKIDKIKLNSDGGLYIEGTENTSADGYYYATNKRFTVNSDLKVTTDKSDKEPYESVYRGPSAPEESDEEESETETSEKETQESVAEPAKEETWSTVTFYKDEVKKETYNFKQKGMFSNKIIFEKTNSDNSALWQIQFVFPDNYEVPYINSAEGFKRANGDFVFWLYLTEKSNGDEKQSVAIFVINKEGRLIRQFQTPGYPALTEFRMTESNGQLTTGVIKYDSPYAFYSFTYLLD